MLILHISELLLTAELWHVRQPAPSKQPVRSVRALDDLNLGQGQLLRHGWRCLLHKTSLSGSILISVALGLGLSQRSGLGTQAKRVLSSCEWPMATAQYRHARWSDALLCHAHGVMPAAKISRQLSQAVTDSPVKASG